MAGLEGALAEGGSNILTGILQARTAKKQRESDEELKRRDLLSEIIGKSIDQQQGAVGSQMSNQMAILSKLMR